MRNAEERAGGDKFTAVPKGNCRRQREQINNGGGQPDAKSYNRVYGIDFFAQVFRHHSPLISLAAVLVSHQMIVSYLLKRLIYELFNPMSNYFTRNMDIRFPPFRG